MKVIGAIGLGWRKFAKSRLAGGVMALGFVGWSMVAASVQLHLIVWIGAACMLGSWVHFEKLDKEGWEGWKAARSVGGREGKAMLKDVAG